MKKKEVFKIKRIKIASLNQVYSIKGGTNKPSLIPEECDTNTNTNSNFCPPDTYTCPPEVTN